MLAVGFWAAALLAAGGPAPAQDAPAWPDEATLAGLLGAFDVPGLAMATLEGCEPGGVVTVGTADLGTGAPVTERTAFEAASLSKPVFAWLVMGLVEEGVIDLDRPIAETFAYPRIADAKGYARITPRMVLTHRTGLPNWVDEATPFHDRTVPIPFETPPGEAFSYSGEAFQLLQAFVEHETGRSLQALFEERLGAVMPHSTFGRPLPDGALPSRGYGRASDPASGRGMENLTERAMAASSLVTTAGDYAAFLARVCRGEGLGAETLAEMLRPQSDAPDEVSVVEPGGVPLPTSWALGWMVVELGGETMVGHGGRNEEYNAFGGFVLEAGDGVVILTNGERGEALIQAVLLPEE